MRRLKYKLSAYDHYSLPHIEKYANQNKWRRGTLEEPVTQEELNQRALKNQRRWLTLSFIHRSSHCQAHKLEQQHPLQLPHSKLQELLKIYQKRERKGNGGRATEMEQEQQQEQQQKQQQQAEGLQQGQQEEQNNKSNNSKKNKGRSSLPSKRNS